MCIIRTAPIPGIGIGPIPGIGIRPIPGIGIRPIPAFFDDIGIGQVRYTSTNFCCLCIIIHKIVFFQKSSSKITKTKLILTTHSIVFPCIGIGTCTCEYI